MQSDPARLWYVFHDGRESGPFPENELQQRLISRELPRSCYVYTEGFDDWRVADEVELLSDPSQGTSNELPEIAPEIVQAIDSVPENLTLNSQPFESPIQDSKKTQAPYHIEESRLVEYPNLGDRDIEFPVEVSDEDSAFEQLDSGEPVDSGFQIDGPGGENDSIQSSAKQKSAETIGVLPEMAESASQEPASFQASKPVMQGQSQVPVLLWVFAGLVVVLVGLSVFFFMQDRAPRETVVTTAPSQNLNLNTFDWARLNEQRLNQSGDRPPYFLESKSLDPSRAVMVGAVSPLLKLRRLVVGVVPDSRRHLLAVPRAWYFTVPVIDNMFVIGPLHVDGEPLPPGVYHVHVRGEGRQLGKVAFEFGQWPDSFELPELQGRMLQRRQQKSVEELDRLKELSTELSQKIEDLKGLGPAAEGGVRSSDQWVREGGAWISAVIPLLDDIRDHISRGTFYPSIGGRLELLAKNAIEVHTGLDLLSKGGDSLLRREKQISSAELWAQLISARDELTRQMADLKGPEIPNFVVSDEAVLQRLEELDQ